MLTLFALNVKWIVRDRILQALVAVSLLLVLLVPVISFFSMRQTQELAVTLSLSCVSFVLLVFSLFLGSTIVWREIERRYTFTVLALPIERGTYILSKFCAVAFSLLFAAILIGACSFVAILISSITYPSQIPVQWGMIVLVILMDTLKYILLAALAILVTTVSTSFFMPFFTSITIFLAGSASQEVYEFIVSKNGEKLNPFVRAVSKAIYYLIPNFSVFDFKLQAIYPIPFAVSQIGYVFVYFLIYLFLILAASVWLFSKRELM